MATLALAATAASGMNPGAYAAMMMIGSFIDNQMLMPFLFPPDPVDGLRLGEVAISGADEGDPAAMVFGQYATVAGEYLWISDRLNYNQHNRRVGKAGRTVERTYFTDAAVAVCYIGERWSPGSIATVDQVFMDEKRVYANANTTPPTTTAETGLMSYWYGANKRYIVFDTRINANAVTDFHDKWGIGDRLDWSGWTNAANNDSGDRVIDKIEVPVYDTFANNYIWLPAFQMEKEKVVENDVGTYSHQGKAATVTATGIAGEGWASGLFAGGVPTVRDGSHTNNWSRLVAEVGEPNAPAWSDMAWLPLPSLVLNDFGGRMPTVRFVVSSHTSMRDPQGIIEEIMRSAGFESSEFDVSGVDAASTVLGYVVRGSVEVHKQLQPLMLAFNIIAQETGKKIVFMDRTDQVANTVEIDSAFVGATEGDYPSGGSVVVQESPKHQRHGEVFVTFTDYDDGNLGKGSARATFMSEADLGSRDTPERFARMSLNFDMTMTEADAKQIAYRMLASSNADVLRFRFTLSPRYLWLQENDRIQITTGGVEYDALIVKLDVGANFLLEVEAVLDVSSTLDYSEWT